MARCRDSGEVVAGSPNEGGISASGELALRAQDRGYPVQGGRDVPRTSGAAVDIAATTISDGTVVAFRRPVRASSAVAVTATAMPMRSHVQKLSSRRHDRTSGSAETPAPSTGSPPSVEWWSVLESWWLPPADGINPHVRRTVKSNLHASDSMCLDRRDGCDSPSKISHDWERILTRRP